MTAPHPREHHDEDPGPPDRRLRAGHGTGLTDAGRTSPAEPAAATTTGTPHVHVGLTDAQRAALVELIQAAPLPPPEAMARLRGYLPPAAPG